MLFNAGQRQRAGIHPHATLPTDENSTPIRGPLAVEAQPLDPDTEPDIIIQHRDGGVAQDLPPPYLDQSQTSPPSSQPPRDTLSGGAIVDVENSTTTTRVSPSGDADNHGAAYSTDRVQA